MAIFERVIVPSRAPLGDSRVIVSPLSLGVTGEDNIRLSVANAFDVPVVATLNVRFLNEQNTIDSWSQSFSITTSRTLESQTWALGVGYILNVTAFISSGAPKIGQCWGKVDIIRGLASSAPSLGTIAGGYMTAGQPLSWPGSIFQPTTAIDGYVARVNSVGGAPGAFVDMAVPTGLHWSLLAVDCFLVADATVATRRPFVTPLTTSIQYYARHTQTVTAGVARGFYWAVGLTGNIDATDIPNTAALPFRTELNAGDIVRINATNLQAGDQFTDANVTVLERLEVA
jgi:hypothetical protein